jgi:hypothetical protein
MTPTERYRDRSLAFIAEQKVSTILEKACTGGHCNGSRTKGERCQKGEGEDTRVISLLYG